LTASGRSDRLDQNSQKNGRKGVIKKEVPLWQKRVGKKKTKKQHKDHTYDKNKKKGKGRKKGGARTLIAR